MNSLVKKEFTLKNMPLRKKTSNKIKTPSTDQFNYRILSLPHQRDMINQNSLLRKSQKQKNRQRQRQKNSSFQNYGNFHHKLIQRKNKSLPKYLYTENREKENQKDKNNNNRNAPEYRLQTVQEILNKKNSKIVIKNSILRPKQSTPLTNKSKNQRASNLKYYFENRKFTNLSKYNTKNDQKQKGEANFKSKTKFSVHSDISEQQQGQKTVRDIDLSNIMDPQATAQINQQRSNESNVYTMQNAYIEAEKNMNVFYSKTINKDKVHNIYQPQKNQDAKYLEKALQMLKHIQKNVGDMSKKTLLLIGRCYFQMKKYDDSIRYLQKVFREVNYNLLKLRLAGFHHKYSISQQSNIYSKRTQQSKKLVVKKYEEYYELLAQSYKKTQNFLSAIKVLNQWQHFIVQKQIQQQIKSKSKSQNIQQNFNKNQQREKTISYLDDIEVSKLKKYSSNHNCSYYEYQIMKTNLQMSQRKKSLSKYEHQSSQHDSILIDKDDKNFKTIQPKMSYSVISSQKYFALLENLEKYDKKSQFCKGYLMRARLQYQIKNYQNAIKDYNKAIVCDQLNLQANLELGSIYYKTGRGDKSISLYKQYEQKIIGKNVQRKSTILDYIRFHKSVMHIKLNELKQANKAFTQIQQNLTSKQLLSQIFYYRGFILLYRGIYDEALIQLQKSISYSTSQRYVIYAYFLRIYIHFFKLTDYYGAQYEIDRMNFTKQSQKINIQFDKIRLDQLHGYYSLADMIMLTSSVICILKMKLTKGIFLLTKLQDKFSTLTHSNSEQRKSIQFYQMIQSIYQFMYFSYYSKRQYKKSLGYLVLLQFSIQRQKPVSLNDILLQKGKIQKHSMITQTQKINHLTLQSIIMMSQNKYQLALQKIKQIQVLTKNYNASINLLNSSDKKNSLSLNFLIKEEGVQKDDNYLNMIKSICYIQLYDYLQKEQEDKKLQQIQNKKVIENSSNGENHISRQNGDTPKIDESNTQILLSAEDILAHCLIKDKQNFQILFLIAVIHYQLKQYESSLNYIRQAIEFSDDHMIKHYYLKANLKLFLGRYQQAAKDYGNAITVYKQLQKQLKIGQIQEKDKINFANIQSEQQNYTTGNTVQVKSTNSEENFAQQERNSGYNNGYNENGEYYQEKQQMFYQIHLNRAIAYIKYSYQVQAEVQKYSSHRQSINNMRQMAAQDVKTYFNYILQQIKRLQSKKSSQIQFKNQSKSTETRHIKLSQQSLIIQQVTNLQKNKIKLEKLKKKLQKNIQLLSLLMHTPSIQHYLEISKSFMGIGFKITTDQELMKYFYMAKQLNNCLIIMEKIVKRSEANIKQGQAQLQPFFKSKAKKTKKNNLNYEVNPTPFLPVNKIQKLKFDHCVLAALKQSSTNLQDDYQSALTSLLQCVQKIAEQKQKDQRAQQNDFCGQIFKWADLLFFTGAIYFMLGQYDSAVKYFLQSFNESIGSGILYSGQNYIKHLRHFQDLQQQMQSSYIDIQSLRLLQQLFENRTYLKQEIQYNIGVCYLMMKQYKQAYNYLSIYPKFVDMIQQELSLYQKKLNNSGINSQDKQRTFQKRQNDEQEENTSQKQEEEEDITPFPSHNRLCSIYNEKRIKNRVFKLSFCLPKIQLPKLNLFYEKQVEMAVLVNEMKSQSETIFAQSHVKFQQSQQFLIQKDKIINFIQIISLKDIQMKPLAPWIKKQKKYIKFTDNILQQSIDLKTQCNTARSKKKHSKQLFGKDKEKQRTNQKPKQKQKSAQLLTMNKKQKKPAQRYVQLQAKQQI